MGMNILRSEKIVVRQDGKAVGIMGTLEGNGALSLESG